MKYKAISLHQPWATFMALGLKTNETRHWLPYYRGDLIIHASQRWTTEQRLFTARLCQNNKAILTALLEAGMRNLTDFPLGYALCVVNFYDVAKSEEIRDQLDPIEAKLGNYEDGRFAWKTKHLRRFEYPYQTKGAQGFFYIDLPNDLRMVEIPPRELAV